MLQLGIDRNYCWPSWGAAFPGASFSRCFRRESRCPQEVRCPSSLAMSPQSISTLLSAFAIAISTAFATDRPHIILVLADDLGSRDMSYRGSNISTPHIDKLASRGVVIDPFYVQSVCSPNRAALMTGRYPIRLGMQCSVVRPWASHGLPLDERTLPQALKESGYTTAVVGKWHLGHAIPEYLPLQRGFDKQYGTTMERSTTTLTSAKGVTTGIRTISLIMTKATPLT